jgi:protein-L-isoaspartate(D-aspartate) O-methyltransferase
MDRAAQAFAEARARMVDSQVRPNKVADPRIIAAMRRLPRERFIPSHLAALAYADDDVPLGEGRFLIEPAVIARMVQLAAVVAGERALVVAAGTGYGAALLAACGARVTALEENASLQATARNVLAELAPSVSLVSGPLRAGWPPGAPYEVILIEGAVPTIPAAIGEQLHRETGRLVAALAGPAGVGQAVLAEATAAGLRTQPMFDCATPPIPGLLAPPSFVF